MRADASCRSCGQPIRWVITASTGKRMPLDPIPVPDGNVWVDRYWGGTPVVNISLTGDAVPGNVALRYVSHFVTCKDADSWRRRK